MKQLLSKVMFVAMLLCFAAQSKALTYNVTVPENTQYCYIKTTDWNPMSKVDDTHFTITIDDADETTTYRYYALPFSEDYVEVDEDGGDVDVRTWSEQDVVVAWKTTPEHVDESKVLYATGVFSYDYSENRAFAYKEDGTVLLFCIYKTNNSDNNENVYTAYLDGTITEDETLVVPERIICPSGEIVVNGVTRFLYSYNFSNICRARNVKDVYLPSTVTSISCFIDGQIDNLHLAAQSVVSLDSSPYPTTVWVPEEVYSLYEEEMANADSKWYDAEVFYEGGGPNPYVVTVNTPGTFGNEVFKLVDQWRDVKYLTVIGSLNDDDIKYFSHMTSLRQLDLSQTNITHIGSCNGLTRLKNIILPETVTSVDSQAFSSCGSLKHVNLPNVVSVGFNAFYDCSSLTSIDLPLAQSIGESAFLSCYSLTSVHLPMAQSIGEEAFWYCSSLTDIDLPMVQSIGNSAFEYCSSLTSVELPMAQSIGAGAFEHCSSLTSVELPMAQSIGASAFEYCSSLTSVELPMAQSIGGSAFYDCSSLTELVLSSHLQSLGSGVINDCDNIRDIYCYAVVPPTTYPFGSGVGGTTLHVPEMSLSTYKLHDSWYGFASVVPIEGEVTDISISDNFAIYDYNGISDNPNLSLTFNSSNSNAAHLTVAAGSELAVNDYVQDVDLYRAKYTTLMSKNPITANTVTMNITVPGKRWNFISFPFDVKVGDIELPEGTLWVIRRYSGENRAAMTGDTWQNMTDDMILKAGEGYILNCLNDEDKYYYSLPITVHAVDNGNKNNIFASADVRKTLEEYPAESANNSSWNLVGNPYPTYFNIKSIAHEAPITIWNGSGYTAYSTEDDDYMIAPFSAFFVQCPEDASSMTFAEEGRSHEKTTTDANYKPRHQAETSERVVMNINLSGNDYTDRARLVLNEKAKAEYEIARDASKFMSSNAEVPQIYVIDNDQRYSIDERPLGNGTFAIGTYFGSSADYTISLDVKNYGGTVTLTDKATGISTDMTQYDYSFTAEAGTYNDRFMLTVGADVTAINGVENGKNTHSVYNVGGVKVDDNARGLLIIDGKKVMK